VDLTKGPDSAALVGGTMTLATWPGVFFAVITGFRTPADNQAMVRIPDTALAFGFRGDWLPPRHALYVQGDICPEPFWR